MVETAWFCAFDDFGKGGVCDRHQMGFMKKIILSLVICCMAILPILSGCSLKEIKTESPAATDEVSGNETRTVSEYVCIREYDGNHGLNDEMMDTFVNRYCEENGLRYVEWFDVKEPGESGYVRLCVFLSEDRSVFGMGYEYPNEKEAVRAFRSGAQLFSASQEGTVSVMSAFSVRVGKYIFWRSGEVWAPILSQVGINIPPQTFQIPAGREIPYVKMAQSFAVEELLTIFREKGYSVYDCWGGYSIIGRDGLETFYLACDDRLLGEYEESKDDLLRQLWDDDSRAIGLTVYRCEDCVVIGRGNTFLSVIGE